MGTPKVGSKFNNSCSLETIIRPVRPKRPELHNLLPEQACEAGRELQRVNLSGQDCLEFIHTKSPPRLSLYYLNGNNTGSLVAASPPSAAHIKSFALT